MIREDNLIAELPFLVGPKLYELDIFTLRMHGHIAYVECHELHIPLTEEFRHAYSLAADTPEERRLIYTTNPNKTRVCATLICRHLDQGHKIMVFCDNLFALEWYALMLKKPKIDGSTQTEERAKILRQFRSSQGGDCVLFSKVGDHSIDLPEADVVIQLALLDGSRMQEGQRIGRIQRYMCALFSFRSHSLTSHTSSHILLSFVRSLTYSYCYGCATVLQTPRKKGTCLLLFIGVNGHGGTRLRR
jgi:DNA excision repair protein ERCC-3